MLDQHFIPITLDPFFHTTTNYHPIIITFRTTINYRSILIQPTLFNFIKFRASPFPLFKFNRRRGGEKWDGTRRNFNRKSPWKSALHPVRPRSSGACNPKIKSKLQRERKRESENRWPWRPILNKRNEQFFIFSHLHSIPRRYNSKIANRSASR